MINVPFQNGYRNPRYDNLVCNYRNHINMETVTVFTQKETLEKPEKKKKIAKNIELS